MHQWPPFMGFEQAFSGGEHLGSSRSEGADSSIRKCESVEVDDTVMRDPSRRAVDTAGSFQRLTMTAEP